MAVEKVFWQDPYLTEISAKVTCVDKNVITVDRTIAFAFSGGQQSDSGTIGGYPILEAKKEGKEIFYELDPNHILKQNDDVIIKIDWEKRYAIMKMHFAAELVLELIYQNYNNPQKIGANITATKARVDFHWIGNISTIFPDLLNTLDKIIKSNLQIVSQFSDYNDELRYWFIEGFAKVPCGGTHIKRTGEIGHVKLNRINLGSGKERIEISLCDERSLR